MIGIILTGHGEFATGLASSVKLIAGSQNEFETVNFIQEDTTNDLELNLRNAINNLEADKIIIFSDLTGGSPFKTAVEVKMTIQDKTIEVIGGTNLGMLVEISMARNFIEGLEDLTLMAINAGKDQIVRYEYKERIEEKEEDGI